MLDFRGLIKNSLAGQTEKEIIQAESQQKHRALNTAFYLVNWRGKLVDVNLLADIIYTADV